MREHPIAMTATRIQDIKTVADARADNMRIMSRLGVLKADIAVYAAETVRLATIAEVSRQPLAHDDCAAVWKEYTAATAAVDEANALFEYVLEMYNGYSKANKAAAEAEATRALLADALHSEKVKLQIIVACYDLDAVEALTEIIHLEGVIMRTMDALVRIDPR
jgi:hypothetical protein